MPSSSPTSIEISHAGSLLGRIAPTTRRAWLFGIFLVLATLIAYGPALVAGFVWDDAVNITDNPLLTASNGLRRIWFSLDSPGEYFPLTFTSFYLERSLWALNPAGYHLVNILLHAANAILVWQLLKRLRVPGAWLAGAIFALHPVQVESAAWVTERKNLLMGFFFLLALLAWIKFVGKQSERPWQFYILALLFYTLALCAKTTACTIPAALILILWLEKLPICWKRWAQIVPFVAIGMVMGIIAMKWESHHHDAEGKLFNIGWAERGLIASRAIWFYAEKLFWPASLTVDYPRWTISSSDAGAYLWVVATTALAGLVWWMRRWTGRCLEVAVVFFVATLSPMLGFVMHHFYMYSFVADHFQYLACIGPIALAAAGIEAGLNRFPLRKPLVLPALGVALLTILGILTWKQCEIYASDETLWQATIQTNPASWLAEGSLGSIAFDNGQLDAAISHYEKALSINPDASDVNYDLGLSFAQVGRLDESIAQYKQDIKINPEHAMAYNNLGFILAKKGQLDEAMAADQKALAIDPRLAGAHVNLGTALIKKGKLDEAIQHLETAVQIEPRIAGEQNYLGIAFAKKGQIQDAIAHFGKAVENNPANPEAISALAWLLSTASDASLRNGAKALDLAEQAHQLAADDPVILQSLAAANAETGHYQDAITIAKQALESSNKQTNACLSEKLRAEIKLYEAGRPERDTGSRWK